MRNSAFTWVFTHCIIYVVLVVNEMMQKYKKCKWNSRQSHLSGKTRARNSFRANLHFFKNNNIAKRESLLCPWHNYQIFIKTFVWKQTEIFWLMIDGTICETKHFVYFFWRSKFGQWFSPTNHKILWAFGLETDPHSSDLLRAQDRVSDEILENRQETIWLEVKQWI